MAEKVGKIYELIPKIMSEIGAIEKSRVNEGQKYKFRGIDDVYNAANPILAKHGVFCIPQVTEMKREERETRGGSVMVSTLLTVKFAFCAGDGSCVEATIVGEGMDTGDKSANKAMSAAQKYAFFQLFCIPTAEVDDADGESPEAGRKKGNGSAGQKPQTSDGQAAPPEGGTQMETGAALLLGRASDTITRLMSVQELVKWRNDNAKLIKASPDRQSIEAKFKERLENLKKAAQQRAA